VWNNTGDKVILRRADGSLKDTCTYPGEGASTYYCEKRSVTAPMHDQQPQPANGDWSKSKQAIAIGACILTVVSFTVGTTLGGAATRQPRSRSTRQIDSTA
jgi:hypothetical protein